jgi:hypothetical protein
MGVHAAATWHPQFWGDPVFSKVAAYVSCSLPRVGVNVARTWAALLCHPQWGHLLRSLSPGDSCPPCASHPGLE